MTKNDYIEAIFKTIEEYRPYSDQLLQLITEEKVNYGVYLVHGITYNYSYRWLAGHLNDKKQRIHGNARKKTKKSEYQIIYKMILQSLEEIKTELAKY